MTDPGLVVRTATAADAGAVAAVYATFVLGGHATFEETPPTPAEIEARMAAAPRRPWLLAERDGEVVGFAYAGTHRVRAAYRWTVETSVYLLASEARRGTATALCGVLLEQLRRLGYALALAAIARPNDPSEALHARLGFTHVGTIPRAGWKLGAWHDLTWWALPLGDQSGARPTEPLAFDGRLDGPQEPGTV